MQTLERGVVVRTVIESVRMVVEYGEIMCKKVMQDLYFSKGSSEKRKLHTMEIFYLNSGFL